ncbi:MAG: tetratricopeptide repeat protein [Gelidibacter sp.]|nr:tetratricopeptide repeat protein [Gelidibacter sp.]
MKTNSNISQELLETVERYHNNTMPANERKTFEAQLQNDTNFKAQVADIKTLLLGIETQALKEQLDSFHNELSKTSTIIKPKPNVRFLNFKKVAVAAILILSLGAFWWFSSSTNSKLYANYFTPDPGLPTTMGTTDNYAFFDAMVNYKQGDYKTAISKWKKLELNDPKNDTINYFLGVAYLADKNTDKAITYLNKTVKVPESVFTKDAYFYLGLAFLKSEKTDKAKEAFQKSSSKKSEGILKALK